MVHQYQFLETVPIPEIPVLIPIPCTFCTLVFVFARCSLIIALCTRNKSMDCMVHMYFKHIEVEIRVSRFGVSTKLS